MGKHLKGSRLSKTQAKRCIKEFLCITHTVEHNYISPSTVGIKLHVSALYVGHLQVVI